MVDPTENGVVAHVPAFLSKLWRLVEDHRYNDLICWSSNGRSFIIKNQTRFSKELLPLYFKHNNMASFIRQLNMYGFRKSTSIENSGLKADKDEMEFYHQYFLRGQESMLEFIKRKKNTRTKQMFMTDSDGFFQVATPAKNGGNGYLCDGSGVLKTDDVKEMITGIHAIRERQDSADNCLMAIQQENAALWKEIAVLRQKHAKQQQIIERLIQFLMTLVQKQPNVVFKRKTQLMIDGGPDDDGDFFSAVDKPSSKRLHVIDPHDSGPVIHDVTNDLLEAELEAGANGDPIVSHIGGEALSPSAVDDILCPSDLLGTDSNPSGTGSGGISPTSSLGGTLTPDMIITTGASSSGTGLDNNTKENNNGSTSALQTPTVASPIPLGTGIDVASTSSDKQVSSSSGGGDTSKASSSTVDTVSDPANFTNGSVVVPTTSQLLLRTTHQPILDVNSCSSPSIVIPSSITSSNLPPNSSFNREYFSDHVEGVDVELNWLQDQLQFGGLDIDPDNILGLFSQESPPPASASSLSGTTTMANVVSTSSN